MGAFWTLRPCPGLKGAAKSPRPKPGARKRSAQPSTFTVTLLTVFALGAVTVSRPSRYTACS